MLFLALGILLLGSVVALIALRTAPDGFEDREGFRHSRSPFAERPKRARVKSR